jgi:regulator of RNase E activity RraB
MHSLAWSSIALLMAACAGAPPGVESVAAAGSPATSADDLPDDGNGEVLRRMLASGADLTQPLRIDFDHLLPTQAAAEQMAAAARQQGFEVIVAVGEDEEGNPDPSFWDVCCSRVMVPSHAAITATELSLGRMAESFGGRADGWGCMLAAPDGDESAYDNAEWHSEGDFPDDLEPENAATHIGMYLSWAFRRGFVGALHREVAAVAVREVEAGRMTGRAFLLQQCDGLLRAEDLDDEGNRFTKAYYDAHYYDDYEACVGEGLASLYAVEDTAANQRKVDRLLDQRLAEWRRRR